jgi:hypothetical protein
VLDESNTAIVSKGPGQLGSSANLSLKGLTIQIQALTTLSSTDKQEMIDHATYLSEKGFQIDKISKSFSTLRQGEELIAKNVLERFKASITPIELKREGVYRPLMSGFISGKNTLEVFIPKDLASYADHGIILELFRYHASVEQVKFTRCDGDINIQNEERLSQLIMGYISELLSDQKIARISYTRSSYYQQGRMLARAKLLEFVTTDLKIPIKYIQVPQRYLGGTTEHQEPESIRVLKTLISGDVDLINDLLKHLAAHIYKMQRSQVQQKIDGSLFTAFPEFVHMFERRARVETKKSRGRKIQSSYTTIKATKPSTLTTVAPWEREAVQELYDSPWNDLSQLEKEFNSTPPLARNYTVLATKLSNIINAQWSNKQILLRKTNHRLVLSGLPDSTPLWQRLNKVRSILAEYKTIETCDDDTIKRIIIAYDILPLGQTTTTDGFTVSWAQAFTDGVLDNKYPAATRLIRSYKDRITPDKSVVTTG